MRTGRGRSDRSVRCGERRRPERWSAADSITLVRIAASVLLLALPWRSAAFFTVYTVAGLSDALDGWVARKTGTASDFGARLDSAADLVFFGALLVRLLPALWPVMPRALRGALAVAVLVRVVAYAAAALRYRRFVALHTRLNKLTGAAVFLLPYALLVSTGVAYGWAVCALALAAALQEAVLHLRGSDAARR